MKDSVSSLDIKYLVDELKILEGGRIQKIYTDEKSIRFRIYNGSDVGELELYLAPGRIFLTKYKRESQKTPSHFCLFLRKYMLDKKIKEIRQRNFDRIIEIVCDDVILVYELFATGNIIMANNEYRIIMPYESQVWKDRRIIPKEKYIFPSSNEDPSTMDTQRLLEYFKKDQGLVQALAFLGFGGTYAEELCLRLGMDKTKSTAHISAEEASKISEQIEEIFSQEPKPMIVLKDGKKHDVVPFDLLVYKDYEKEEFETFSEALDKYFSEEEIKTVSKKNEKVVDEKRSKVEKKIDEQKKAVEKFVKKEEDAREDANAMEMDYDQLERIIFTIQKFIKDKESWHKIKEQMRVMFSAEVDENNGTLKTNLSGRVITIDFKMSPRENITKRYQDAKTYSEKQKGATKALEQSQKELESLGEIEIKAPQIVEKRNKKWFEKFRWFISSDGILCIGGRDATQNEMVVKKHMDSEDIVFHADIHGSPFVVVKTGGKKVSEDTIHEAARFTANYCSAWKDGRAVDVYWVKPDQVRKDAPSGMYVAKGSFMIYGQKNYIKKIKLELTVGVVLSQEGPVVMAGAEHAIKSHTKYYVNVVPGSKGQNEIAKSIRATLSKIVPEDEKQKIERIPIEEFQRTLPPGGSEIIKND